MVRRGRPVRDARALRPLTVTVSAPLAPLDSGMDDMEIKIEVESIKPGLESAIMRRPDPNADDEEEIADGVT